MASDGQPRIIDWRNLYKRLFLFARALTCGRPDIFDGMSADDLVSETILAFLKSNEQLGWNSKIASVEVFLCAVLRHKAIDHFRRHARAAGSLDDPNFNFPIPLDNGQQLLQETLALEEMICSVKESSTESKLADLIRATSFVSNDGRMNEQLAEILGTTQREIVNLKKRLVRLLKSGKGGTNYGRYFEKI